MNLEAKFKKKRRQVIVVLIKYESAFILYQLVRTIVKKFKIFKTFLL